MEYFLKFKKAQLSNTTFTSHDPVTFQILTFLLVLHLLKKQNIIETVDAPLDTPFTMASTANVFGVDDSNAYTIIYTRHQ